MGTNKEALNECIELSHNINDMGLGINSKRAACEIYRNLVASSANVGAYIMAADYVPMRNQRVDASVDAMKEVSKVIYLLNVARDSGFFVMEAVKKALVHAVNLSKCLNDLAAAYMGIDFEAERQKAELRRAQVEAELAKAEELKEQQLKEEKLKEKQAKKEKRKEEAQAEEQAEAVQQKPEEEMPVTAEGEADPDGFDDPYTEE